MRVNQTAKEIAEEYGGLAIHYTNQVLNLRRRSPFETFPTIEKTAAFYTDMYELWTNVTRQLREGPWVSDTEQDISEDEWGIRE